MLETQGGIVDPLYAFAFLQTFIDILQDYFGQLSAITLKDNFDVVYQVSLPFLTIRSSVLKLDHFVATGRNLGLHRVPEHYIPKCTARYSVAPIFVTKDTHGHWSIRTSEHLDWDFYAFCEPDPVAEDWVEVQQ